MNWFHRPPLSARWLILPAAAWLAASAVAALFAGAWVLS